jgi:hypothetical protein
METFAFTVNAIAGLVFSEAVREIGKNIGKAISNFVSFAVNFIADKISGYFKPVV